MDGPQPVRQGAAPGGLTEARWPDLPAEVVNSQIWSKWCEAICFGYAKRRRRKPFGFQVLRHEVAGQMAHIVPTLKRLQAASSNRSAGGKPPTFAPLLASSCRFSRHFDDICESTTYSRLRENGFQRTVPSLAFSRTSVSRPEPPTTARPIRVIQSGYSLKNVAPMTTAQMICE